MDGESSGSAHRYGGHRRAVCRCRWGGRFVGTEDNGTLKPYDRTDWSYIEAEQQDIEWPEEESDDNEAEDNELPF